MVSQFHVGVKCLVAAITIVLVVSWEVLVFHMVKGGLLRCWDLSTDLALELSLSCSPRYTHHVLIQISSSTVFFPTGASLLSKFCVRQYSQNIDWLLNCSFKPFTAIFGESWKMPYICLNSALAEEVVCDLAVTRHVAFFKCSEAEGFSHKNNWSFLISLPVPNWASA